VPRSAFAWSKPGTRCRRGGEDAAKEIHARASALGGDDLLLVLVSGGGSSLLSLPVDGIGMADLKAVTRDLLASGAPIQDMNTVRKHVSAIQGGRLALATPARTLALVISDVTGDDPTHIASGPCSPDPTTYGDAIDILAAFGVTAPAPIATHLARGAAGAVPETPKPGNPGFNRVATRVIATAHASLMAAAAFVQGRGVTPMVLGDSVTGESREVAKGPCGDRTPAAPALAPLPAACGRHLRGRDHRHAAWNRQGRAVQRVPALARRRLGGLERTWALAADTDGIDGAESQRGGDRGGPIRSRARGCAGPRREEDAREQ